MQVGNPVKLSGVKVGSVTDVTLDHGDALVTFSVDGVTELGSQTSAHIGTGTLLGERMLNLQSAGEGTLRPNGRIPVERTSSPYSLTDAVGDLTTTVAHTDTASLNQSLDVLATTVDEIAPQLGGPTFDELTRLSRILNGRDQKIGELLEHAAMVSGIVAERSDAVNTMLLDANDLTAVLADRRRAIVNLLADTSALAQRVSGLIHDNQDKLKPTLDKLNAVTAVLERNRDNLEKALPGLAKFQGGLSELVANGPYYIGYIPNLTQARCCSPSWTMRSASGAVPTAVSRRTTRAPPSRNSIPAQRDSATRRAVGTMMRRALRLITVIVLAGCLTGGAALLTYRHFFAPITITADFQTATAIYPGDQVQVSGGVRVGTIESVQPRGGTFTRMTLTVDRRSRSPPMPRRSSSRRT